MKKEHISDALNICHAFTVFPIPWLNDKNSTANFVSLGLSGNIFFFHACTSFPTWTQNISCCEGTQSRKIIFLDIRAFFDYNERHSECVLRRPVY